MSNRRKLIYGAAGAVLIPFMVTGCGGSGSSSASSGNIDVAVTDAPSPDFDHVWVTIQGIAFHTSDSAGPNDAGWQSFSLPAPVTVDLAALNNGQTKALFQGLSLPAGTYQQVRLFLVSTEKALSASAVAQSLQYNNEVDYTDSSGVHHSPLRIFNVMQGIRLAGTFPVNPNTALRLAFDFDVGHDVIAYAVGTGEEFLLKPRLNYFDLDNAGAVVGNIDPSVFSSGGGYNIVVKAERLSADGTRHVVARATLANPVDGSFVLYPLPVTAGSQTTDYDIVIRGRNVATHIIRGVPVTRGTTPASNPTPLQSTPVLLASGNEYTANFAGGIGNGPDPTGAWVNFYETLDASVSPNEVPYEIRYRHVNPYTDAFTRDIPLSNSQLQYGTYANGAAISFTPVTPKEGVGQYDAWAGALFYNRTHIGTGYVVPSATLPVILPKVSLQPPANDTLSGTIASPDPSLDTGYLVVSRGGVVVTTVDVSGLVAAGGQYSVSLQGGSPTALLPGAFYTAQIYAWNSTDPINHHAYAVSPVVDLRSGSVSSVDMTLASFF